MLFHGLLSALIRIKKESLMATRKRIELEDVPL
jgi:hypothetical protein